MAMGIATNEEFEAELQRLDGASQNGKVINIQKGRGLGGREVPESLRKIIGENAIEEGSAETKLLTRALGISDSSLSAYKNGATSTTSYHEGSPQLKSHINQAKERISTKARNRLTRALNHMTDDKLSECDARDLAGVAKDMSAIVKNMEPEVVQQNNNQHNQFVIYAPQTINEDRFETIQVNE